MIKNITILFFIFSICICKAQTSKIAVLDEINQTLRSSPSSDGSYSLISILKEKFVVNNYDKQNHNWCKTEAYFTDLKIHALRRDYGAIKFDCNGGNLCVKCISTITYNIKLSGFETDKHINSIDDAPIDPVYIEEITIEFEPDSKTANKLNSLFEKLFNTK